MKFHAYIEFDAFNQIIDYPWGYYAFIGRYRIQLFDLQNNLGLGRTTVRHSIDRLLCIPVSQISQLYWLLQRGVVNLIEEIDHEAPKSGKTYNKTRLDGSSECYSHLDDAGLSSLTKFLKTVCTKAEKSLAISLLDDNQRSWLLQSYGYCPEANKYIRSELDYTSTREKILFGRAKSPSTRYGMPASSAVARELLRRVLQKSIRGDSYRGFPLFTRVMPSAGSLCSIEGLLITATSAELYRSNSDKFESLSLSDQTLQMIHSDLWLNCGTLSAEPTTAIILLATLEPFTVKYGCLAAQLQSVETGIVLGDMWSLLPDLNLSACIIGNPMLGSLTNEICKLQGASLVTNGLILFHHSSKTMLADQNN